MICPKCKSECNEFGICPNCGNVNDSELLMCPYCGKVIRMGEEICPRCGREIREKKIFNGLRNERVAYTPKYVAKTPFSMPSILLIMLFMIYSLGYNIVVYTSKINGEYSEYNLGKTLLALISTDTRPFVLLFLSILSVVTFIYRITINHGKMDTDSLNKRLTVFKGLVLADFCSFFTYFFISFWPSVFVHDTNLYKIGATIGICIVVVCVITLPIFYRKSKIRTR